MSQVIEVPETNISETPVTFTAENYRTTLILLISKYPFYGTFISNLNWKFTEEIKTACVALVGSRIELWMNPRFMSTLKVSRSSQNGNSINDEVGAILIHEIQHIVEGHLLAEFPPSEDPLSNIAQDLYINQFQEQGYSLPDNFLDIHNPKWKPFNLVPKIDSSVDIYIKLKQNRDKLPKGAEPEYGFIILDKDGNKIDVTEQQRILLENSIKQQIQEAVKDCPPGKLPQSVEKSIWWRPKPSVVPWNNQFRQWAASSISTERRLTRTRISRFHESRVGQKFKQKLSLLVMLDVSGSVSDENLTLAFNELHALYKKGADIDIIQVDTQVHHRMKYQGKWERLSRHASGGTCLAPGVKVFIENKYDGLVCFTDGEFSITDIYSHHKLKKSLWIHFPSYQLNSSLPGRSLSMDWN